MKTAKILWSLGSILVNITIGIYIYLQINGPKTLEGQFQYINDNWAAYSGHWKAEFLIMTLITIGAIYFALNLKNISWTIISVGQIIILLTYPFMMGGYHETPYELAKMANQMALLTFVFGNLIFLAGLFHLYLHTDVLKAWLRYIALTISGIATIAFLLIFIGVITWKDAMLMGPLINALYLINAYYGFQMKDQNMNL